jgi:hypothetical protein
MGKRWISLYLVFPLTGLEKEIAAERKRKGREKLKGEKERRK